MGRRKHQPSVDIKDVTVGRWIARTNDERDGRPPVDPVDFLVVTEVASNSVTVKKWLGVFEVGQAVLGRLSKLEEKTLAGKRYRLIPESEQPQAPAPVVAAPAPPAVEVSKVTTLESLRDMLSKVDPTSPLYFLALGMTEILDGQRRLHERLDFLFVFPALPPGALRAALHPRGERGERPPMSAPARQPCGFCEALRGLRFADGTVSTGCRFCAEEREVEAVVAGTRPWVLQRGDSRLMLSSVPTGSVHLAYLDPPFNKGKLFKTKGQEEIDFDDRWPSLEDFRDFLRSLLWSNINTLAPEGSIVVHCDPSFSPLVRELLDLLLGREHWADEIVWSYKRWSTEGRHLARQHDTLIRYVVDPKRARFNQLYQPLAASTLAAFGTKKQKAVVKDGRRRKSVVGDEESKGAPLGTVWEIPVLAPCANERLDYSTQKPEALLSQIISAFSNRGDIVLDSVFGSGTCPAVAVRLGRRAIGFDKGERAYAIAMARMGRGELPLFTGSSVSPVVV